MGVKDKGIIMADDKDDNGLKKAEEALEKAERKLAHTVEGTPAHKKAAEALVKAKENRLAANFRKGQRMGDLQEPPLITPAIIDPRGREVLDTPPAPTAPTMENLGGSGQLAPLRSNSDTIADRAKSNGLDLPPAPTAPVGESKKTPEEKIANQLRKAKALGAANLATMLAEEKKNADTAARRSEKERQVRERHDKDKPSAWEMGFATMTGGLGGLLFGTYGRFVKASRAGDREIEKLREQNRLTDAAMGRAVTGARTGRTAASVRDGGWSAADKKNAADASSVFTHNIWEPYINPKDSKGNRVNILVGLDDIFKPEDSYEKNVKDIEKVFKKAAKNNPKAVLLARKINSRILGVMKDNAEKVSTKDKFAWNKERLSVAVYKSFPSLFDEDMRESVINNINFADDKAVYAAMASNAKLAATHSLFDALAASKDRKFDKFKKRWRDVLANEKGVLSNSEALDNLLSETVADSNAIWNNLEVFETLQKDSNKAGERFENAKLNGKPPKEIARLEKEFKASKARQKLAGTIAGKTGMELVVNDDGSWGVRSEASEGQSLIKGFTDDKGRYRWTPDINSINKIQGATPAETKVLRVRALAEAKAIIADLSRHPAGSLVSVPANVDDIVTPEEYRKFVEGLTPADHDEYAKTFDSVIARVVNGDVTLETVRDGGDLKATAEQMQRLGGDARVFKYIEMIIEAKRKE